jgi:hypothetical protein
VTIHRLAFRFVRKVPLATLPLVLVEAVVVVVSVLVF